MIISVISLLIGFLCGFVIGKRKYASQVKELNNKLTSVVSKSSDKLTTAYEKIELLTKDNKRLIKQLNTMFSDGSN